MSEDSRISEIREAVRKYFDEPEPAWCSEDANARDATDGNLALESIRAILDREPTKPQPQAVYVSELAGFLSTLMPIEKARGVAGFLDAAYRFTRKDREVQS